jgi:hypothetical protein
MMVEKGLHDGGVASEATENLVTSAMVLVEDKGQNHRKLSRTGLEQGY